MANEIQTSKTFEQKMKDRIRESMGDLLSDEDLSKIVNRGMEEIFFKPRQRTSGYSTVEEPPLIHEIVKKVMWDQISTEVRQWVTEHPEEVKEIVGKVLAEGAGHAVVNAINGMLSSAFYQFQSNVEDLLNTRR